ncbi:MAG: DUF1801 domain-containing protein [Caulobacteraceae bacterium]
MAKAENKTRPTGEAVEAFLATVTPEAKREDAHTICAMMQRLSGWPPTMWGPTIVGFGLWRYRYDSGREGDSLVIGFSPRKPSLVLYLNPSVQYFPALLAKLGAHTTGVACLYIKRLSDVDLTVLEAMIAASLAKMRADYPAAIRDA